MQGRAHRTALVTGGTRGIGRGIVRQLIASGVRVATVYHEDESAARALIGEGEGAGLRPLVARINVADFEPLEARVEIEEIAAAVRYFLSDLAASVTGQCLAVNGGLST